MMQVRVTTNAADVARALEVQARQVSFAASKALNDTAREVRRAIPDALRKGLDRPTPFTTSESGLFIRPARKDALTAWVLFKDRQASYLRYQANGGVYAPRAGFGLKLPTAIGRDAYGNIPRGVIRKLVAVARKESKLGKRKARRIAVSSKVELFYGDPTDAGGRRFPYGIYKVVKVSAERSQLVPLVVFPDQPATYRKRVDLMAAAKPVVASSFGPAFNRALRAALATAR